MPVSSTLQQITDHLAFLGYRDEPFSADNIDTRFANHATTPGLILADFGGGVSIRCLYQLNESKLNRERLKFFEALNQFNSNAAISNGVYSGKGWVSVCVWVPCYTRESFGNTIVGLEHDFDLLGKGDFASFLA